MNIIRFYLFIFLTSSSLISYSQTSDSSSKYPQLPGGYYLKIDKKINSLKNRLTKNSLKYLAKFQRQEKKIQQKVEKLKSPGLTNVFANPYDKYQEFSQKLQRKTTDTSKIISAEYNPYLDSLGTSLSFLKQFNGISDKVKGPLTSLNELQDKLQQSEKIKAFIAERKNQIKEVLSRYTKIPAVLKKKFENLNRTAYYYSAQIKEYKEMLKDPKKAEQKALTVLNKIPAFQKFMKQTSQLASLFRVPDDYGMVQNLTGLQTRNSVQDLIQQEISASGPDAMAIVRQNMAQATSELSKLKEKVSKLSGGSSDMEIPDFKENNQKTKSFFKRLEYTTDLQFAKTNNLLPSGANIGLGLGYKLNDKSVVGIGISYKMGMGNIQHISITHQGIGFRTYADYKIKGSLFISGGYEMNYNAAFKNIEQLKDYSAWQRSALIGVSKKYKISKKVKGEMKLLYDFLANQHIPVSQPLIYRIGYNIK